VLHNQVEDDKETTFNIIKKDIEGWLQKDNEKLLQNEVARRELKEREQKDRAQKLGRKQQVTGFVSKQMTQSIYVKRLYPTDPKDEDKATFDGISYFISSVGKHEQTQ